MIIRHWIFIFFFPCLTVSAQTNKVNQSAIELHQDGITLLNKKDLSAFDKLKALKKFLQCHQALERISSTDDTLSSKNETHIRNLFTLFTKHPNTDSLLQATRFFPDSIFQANTNYSAATKPLITQVLDLQRTVNRISFFNLQSLSYPRSLLQEGEISPSITFEQYWSQEVFHLEKWIENKERLWRNYPKKIKEELLTVHLQNKVAILTNQEQITSSASNKRMLEEHIERTLEEVEVTTANYDRFKKIGFGAMGVLLLLGYFLWRKKDRQLKNNTQSLLEEKKRSEDLLTNVLPAEVVRELKRKGSVKAQKKEAVSVFFSDFKNFSQIAETLSPEELVQELDTCFTIFDRIIDKYRLQKIKTIGDAYMCVGGLHTQGGNHVYRMILASLEIQQFLADRKKDRLANGEYYFEARIGVHTGPIVAGVIGRKKIAFDIWGDTVNVAQQMEQHGEAGKVNISGETFHLVKDKLDCAQRGTITVKNKKEYDMYFVDSVVKS